MSGACQNWTGYITPDGYGRQWYQGKRDYAHRVAYTQAHGPIPEGLTVDHLCFNPACVNPAHLRLLTRSENARNHRDMHRPHCAQGHAFDAANTYVSVTKYGTPKRQCRTCNAASQRRRKARMEAAAEATS